MCAVVTANTPTSDYDDFHQLCAILKARDPDDKEFKTLCGMLSREIFRSYLDEPLLVTARRSGRHHSPRPRRPRLPRAEAARSRSRSPRHLLLLAGSPAARLR